MSWYILKTGTKNPAFYINNIWLLMVHLPTLCNGKTLSDLVSLWSHGVMCIPVRRKEKQVAVGATTYNRQSSLHLKEANDQATLVTQLGQRTSYHGYREFPVYTPPV